LERVEANAARGLVDALVLEWEVEEAEAAAGEVGRRDPADKESRLQCGRKFNWFQTILHHIKFSDHV
jgi:hypothetical protein